MSRHSAKLFSLLGLSLLLLLPQTPGSGQEVPSPSQVLGYELGERFTTVAGISHYFSALAEASDLVSVQPYGLDAETFVLSRGRAFEPGEGFESVAFFPEGLEKISGVISEESLERLDRSTWLAQASVGRGNLILFVEDPLFRMFQYTGFQFFANALLFGPAS